MFYGESLENTFHGAVEATKFLKSISSPHRLLMICAAMESPGVTNGEMAQKCGLSISAASQHLTKMCEDQILYKEKEGQKSRYYVKHETTKDIIYALKKAYEDKDG
ncbi:ArsR/SmtB family transcription factor [Acinetobacter boissieri]|uniref:DNA-binding transcriptional regulator, ArsR family n=1 Tax=Acinetobacter boissieri TaxID=1219383 RepID=A0A1G6HIN7_9GAMM|nr:winged helix-turn-helix transcriptional regulator [Acinetobacter boissieri]SDB93306.1 DNA-binding transcriptional regulator, ArsR family [Acinetobacter boissieri]